MGKARDDLRAAQGLIALEDQADHVIGFHLQQAVEKSLKALLASGELEIPYTHDLELLAELARSLIGADLPEAVEHAKWLTPWGVVFRYDDDADDLDRDAALDIATEAIALAERTLDERRRD